MTKVHQAKQANNNVNIDESEIEKFAQLSASDWWDANGAQAPLHHINPLRMAYIQRASELQNAKVLDIGCGGGILCESLARAGANVTGIDLASNAIEVAKHHAKQDPSIQIDYYKASAEDFAEKHPEQFDVITCMEMLEHVPDPASIIEACARLLKPQGKIFLSTLNRNIKSYLYAIIGAEYILKLLPQGTHDYAKFIRPSELSRVLREKGFTVKNMEGLHYNILTKKYSLQSDISVNYLLYAQKQ